MVAQVVSSRPHGVSKIKALGLSPCSECPFPVLCAAPEMDLLGSSPGWNMGGGGALEQVGSMCGISATGKILGFKQRNIA